MVENFPTLGCPLCPTTVITTARYGIISWARWIHSTLLHDKKKPLQHCPPIFVLSLWRDLLPSGFPVEIYCVFATFRKHVSCPDGNTFLRIVTLMLCMRKTQILKFSLLCFIQLPVTSPPHILILHGVHCYQFRPPPPSVWKFHRGKALNDIIKL